MSGVKGSALQFKSGPPRKAKKAKQNYTQNYIQSSQAQSNGDFFLQGGLLDIQIDASVWPGFQVLHWDRVTSLI